jgi:fatty acid desaturase
MEMFYQFGLTQKILEGAILFGGAAVLLAVFWRLIVIGGGIILIAFIFMHHQPDAVASIDSQHKEFMEDCMKVAMNDKSNCDTIWEERQREERR